MPDALIEKEWFEKTHNPTLLFIMMALATVLDKLFIKSDLGYPSISQCTDQLTHMFFPM